ncbi:unnamed protein product, partial [Rotaria sp. Silwood2]
FIFLIETSYILQTCPIYSSNSSNNLYPVLPQTNDISDSLKRSTSAISHQHQHVNNINIVPPPVPPRPNKDLIRERLFKPLNSEKPDICEISHSQQTHARLIP